jgi:uncharacterized protein (TIGR02145 family)
MTEGANLTVISNLPRQASGFVMDMDGIIYRTIRIGNQEWTVENIRTRTLNDGTAIPLVTDASWSTTNSAAYCFYNNSTNSAEQKKCGALYNGYAIETGKLAPPPQAGTPSSTDWHVPSDADWAALANFLSTNGYNYDGSTSGNLFAKSMATGTWSLSSFDGAVGKNLAMNNRSCFSALSTGKRYDNGNFFGQGSEANWWTTTPFDASNLKTRFLFAHNPDLIDYYAYSKRWGFSVRLVRDLN